MPEAKTETREMENRPGWGPGLEALSKWEWEIFRPRNIEKRTP